MQVVFQKSQVAGVINAPASKSFAQRVFACALLTKGVSVIERYTPCDDSERALEALTKMGAIVERQNERVVISVDRLTESEKTLNFGASATSMRIFTGVACVTPGIKVITGDPQLLKRPIKPLIQALKQLGAKIECENDHPPLTIYSSELHGGVVSLDVSISSQFSSALMICTTKAKGETLIQHTNIPSSKGYILITQEVLKLFGGKVYLDKDLKNISIIPSELKPVNYALEGDYSSAAYLLAAGAISGEVEVRNLNAKSLQPDRFIIEALRAMGCRVYIGGESVRVSQTTLEGYEFDVDECPDLAPILSVLGAYAKGRTKLTGITRLRYKESDRVSSIKQMLESIGVHVNVKDESIEILGGEVRGGVVHSNNDHRIALAAAVASCASKNPIQVIAFECYTKSYPQFLEHFSKLGAKFSIKG